jgi:RND family efflux transporter MFP subunit
MMRRSNSPVIAVIIIAIVAGLGVPVLIHNSSDPNAASITLEASAVPSAGVTQSSDPCVVTQPETENRGISQFIGVVFPGQSIDIVARSEGRLEATYVNLGDYLKPGDVIARAETSSAAQQLEQAEAALRSAQAEARKFRIELKGAESRYARREDLAKAGVLSIEELAAARFQVEKAEADLEVSQARVAERTALIEQSKEALANTLIKAPFEGAVSARYLDPGAIVHSGTPIIGLIRLNDLWVRFAVPHGKRASIATGMTISFYLEGSNDAISAVVERLSPGVAAMSQELVVEARLRIPLALNGRIKPGGSGLVSLSPPLSLDVLRKAPSRSSSQ